MWGGGGRVRLQSLLGVVYQGGQRQAYKPGGMLVDNKKDSDWRGGVMGGVIMLGVGTLFLLSNLDLIPDIHVMWPVIVMIVGLALILGSLRKGQKSDRPQ